MGEEWQIRTLEKQSGPKADHAPKGLGAYPESNSKNGLLIWLVVKYCSACFCREWRTRVEAGIPGKRFFLSPGERK